MIEAQGTPFSRGLIKGMESAKEIEHEQPSFCRSKTRRKHHVIFIGESPLPLCTAEGPVKIRQIYPVGMIAQKSLCP